MFRVVNNRMKGRWGMIGVDSRNSLDTPRSIRHWFVDKQLVEAIKVVTKWGKNVAVMKLEKVGVIGQIIVGTFQLLHQNQDFLFVCVCA